MSGAPGVKGGPGSGGLAPSKSTVYVSNLPFSLTNNDLHKIFEKHGRIGKVTIVKDKDSRQSKGVAFILYVERESAHKCIKALNNQQMFGRTIKCSIAKDNGRAAEFIRRKVYKDKVRCYECGEEGHLSYACSHNLLGEREPPPKKERKRKKKPDDASRSHPNDSDSEASSEEEADRRLAESSTNESLAAAISYQQQQEMVNEALGYSEQLDLPSVSSPQRKKYKKDAYFSDEEELD